MSLADLYQNLDRHPDARITVCTRDGRERVRTFAELRRDVGAAMRVLERAGLSAGDFVAILSPNSYEWIVADLALLTLGCVPVALPAEYRPGDPADLEELASRYALSAVLVAAKVPIREPATEFTADLSAGGELKLWVAPPPSNRPQLPEGVRTLVFSSGTAGTRKCLMLNQSGIDNTIAVSRLLWRVGPADNLLIVMPFSSFQQRYLIYLAITTGAHASVVAPERMLQKMKLYRPTIVLGPPSFFEVVATRIDAAEPQELRGLRIATALHRWLPGLLAPRRLLGRRWTGIYGDRVRLLFTGSAPVPQSIVTLFLRLGMPLYELYGSTEVGWIAANLPARSRPGTAGRTVPGVRVVLGQDGEVLVKTGTPQASGYVFEGTADQETVFLPDDTVATGDLAEFDGDWLRLVGRKKNVLITRSGVKINPEILEQELEADTRISRAMVYIEPGATVLAAVLWLDNGAPGEVREQIAGAVRALAARHSHAHRIERVGFRPAAELSVESGLLTRNLKLDRAAVLRNLAADETRSVAS
ncbi:AMP-binding protein [Nocardia thailandica]|uniref:AMP-binding protein n=1 Tax=Nocardia thailandica TaxID=257275 RepID=UPI0003102010|nr:AMP-binding protein [Nocardia thailandica]